MTEWFVTKLDGGLGPDAVKERAASASKARWGAAKGRKRDRRAANHRRLGITGIPPHAQKRGRR